MGLIIAAIVIIGLVILLFKIKFSSPSPPKLDLNACWGLMEKTLNDTSIRPFKVVFDVEVIEDLRYRLANQRHVPPPLEGVGFKYGFNTDELNGWLRYWAEEYPFKEREEFLNQFPQYKTNIQGLDIHFIRVKPEIYPHQEVVPLLLLHGWPGSVREFYETIPFLTSSSENRDFAVEVIVPSLPGFGFSDAAVRPGLGAIEMAVVLRNLMQRLGHKMFYVQGGDWGAYIGASMATLFPKEVLGYHTNLAIALTQKALALTLLGAVHPPWVVDSALASRMYPLTRHFSRLWRELGYFHLQAGKPDTIGVSMTDSPGGLLAYVLQLFSSGTRRRYVNSVDGGLDNHYTRDQLIDNLMMYWIPNSITTSFRIYSETLSSRTALIAQEVPTPVPTCTIHAKDEVVYQSPTILRTKFHNLLNVTVLDEGGHFLALEMPELFAEDVLNGIGSFRNWHARHG